jgi:hypothetical protein
VSPAAANASQPESRCLTPFGFSGYKFWKAATFLPLCCALFTTAFATRGYGAFHFDDAQVYTASELLMYMSPYVLTLSIPNARRIPIWS